MKTRLDQELVKRGLVSSRSQAESYIKLGEVTVDGKVITKSGYFVSDVSDVALTVKEQYVSRAALKLASVAQVLKLDFTDKTVLDIGSSTGGFTQYALKHGAKKVVAVEVGTNQLHPSLRNDLQIELHENTDFRKFVTTENIDIFLADVSFISLREILPNALSLGNKHTIYVIMVKPQFEAGDNFKHKGVIKNDKIRRAILKDFEDWASKYFTILDKSDSEVAGAKGNRERFYLLKKL
jgi:23S rRNA (cytidine1920-2'-O)/16S rRNA (cytidine1409-2'-O)-methyltransferase